MRSAADMLEVVCPEPAAVVARMLSARSCVASGRHLSGVVTSLTVVPALAGRMLAPACRPAGPSPRGPPADSPPLRRLALTGSVRRRWLLSPWIRGGESHGKSIDGAGPSRPERLVRQPATADPRLGGAGAIHRGGRPHGPHHQPRHL